MSVAPDRSLAADVPQRETTGNALATNAIPGLTPHPDTVIGQQLSGQRPYAVVGEYHGPGPDSGVKNRPEFNSAAPCDSRGGVSNVSHEENPFLRYVMNQERLVMIE